MTRTSEFESYLRENSYPRKNSNPRKNSYPRNTLLEVQARCKYFNFITTVVVESRLINEQIALFEKEKMTIDFIRDYYDETIYYIDPEYHKRQSLY